MDLIRGLLFPAPEPSYGLHSYPGELLWIPEDLDYGACRAGDALPAVLLQHPTARYLVLHFHSNGEDVGWCYQFGSAMRSALEVHVLLVEYPGYGISPGRCSEEALWRAARSALRFVTEAIGHPSEDVIVMGRSLGAAIATRLASVSDCHGLVLVSPFSTMADAVGRFVGGSLVGRQLVGDAFDSARHIEAVKVPTLVVHGQEDILVPCAQGRLLFDRCPHGRKQFVSPSKMGHNDCVISNPKVLLHPMVKLFCLPDYSFVDLRVPQEAFDKRLCLQFHNLVESVRMDAPLAPLLGDDEPLANSSGGRAAGPQCMARSDPRGARGDAEDPRSPSRAKARLGGRPAVGGDAGELCVGDGDLDSAIAVFLDTEVV